MGDDVPRFSSRALSVTIQSADGHQVELPVDDVQVQLNKAAAWAYFGAAVRPTAAEALSFSAEVRNVTWRLHPLGRALRRSRPHWTAAHRRATRRRAIQRERKLRRKWTRHQLELWSP